MATTYKVHNSLNNSVVTEYWDDIPVKKTCISHLYHGGDIVQFLEEHKLHVVSKVEYIENIIKWLKGGI